MEQIKKVGADEGRWNRQRTVELIEGGADEEGGADKGRRMEDGAEGRWSRWKMLERMVKQTKH